MPRYNNSLTDIIPYDVWIEVFNYFSIRSSGAGSLDEVYNTDSDLRSVLDGMVSLAIHANLQAKCLFRLVSKEFRDLSSLVFYEVLLFKKWSQVSDLLALIDGDAHVREILTRATRRIDLPRLTETVDNFSTTATLLLSAYPNVTHLTWPGSFELPVGMDLLEQMRIMGFGPKLRYLHLIDSHVGLVIPYLHCFQNLEIVRLSNIKMQKREEMVLPASIFMPMLRELDGPYSLLSYMMYHILETPLLPRIGYRRTSDLNLWKTFGSQFVQFPAADFCTNFQYLQYCCNLESLVLPLWAISDLRLDDMDKSSSMSGLNDLVVTNSDGRSWMRGHKQEKMDSVYRNLVKGVEQGFFPSLKKFTLDVPKFRRRAWNVFPWASRVWHCRLTAKGVHWQLFDQDGALNCPKSDEYF